MTEDEQRQFLEDGWTLQVATNGHDGFPHLVAMWYVVIDGKIHFTTFRKSQKVMNLKRDSKITAMLEAGKQYAELQGLVIQGEGEIVDDLEATQQVMAFVGSKYNGIPADSETSEQARALASKRVVIRINPEDIYSWDHRKLGGRY
jgi:PPOX class probable F420-dependent enzyme